MSFEGIAVQESGRNVGYERFSELQLATFLCAEQFANSFFEPSNSQTVSLYRAIRKQYHEHKCADLKSTLCGLTLVRPHRNASKP